MTLKELLEKTGPKQIISISGDENIREYYKGRNWKFTRGGFVDEDGVNRGGETVERLDGEVDADGVPILFIITMKPSEGAAE